MFSTIRAALEAAAPNDEICILDAAVYEEQVNFYEKSRIVLRSEYPESDARPVIKWRDTENTGPLTCQDATDEDKITFDKNGALRIMKSRDITIEGIIIDGGGTFIFGAEAVWAEPGGPCRYPNQAGNAGMAIWRSASVTVRNCEIRNAYYGISIKDINEGGRCGAC